MNEYFKISQIPNLQNFEDVIMFSERAARIPSDQIVINKTERKYKHLRNPKLSDNQKIQTISYNQYTATFPIFENANISNLQRAGSVIWYSLDYPTGVEVEVTSIANEQIGDSFNYKCTVTFYLKNVWNNIENYLTVPYIITTFGNSLLTEMEVYKAGYDYPEYVFKSPLLPIYTIETPEDKKDKKGNGSEVKLSQTFQKKIELVFWLTEFEKNIFDLYVKKAYSETENLLRVKVKQNITSGFSAGTYLSIAPAQVEIVEDNELIDIYQRNVTIIFESEVYNYFA